MTTYKLTYFNTQGRAELIRFIFAQAGVQYEDKRITKEEWVELKSKTPYGALPILEFDGKVLAGSKPIAGYLAVKHGLAGSNNFENAELGGIGDVVEDLILRMMLVHFEQDETRKIALKKDLDETHLPRYLGILERVITENGQDAGWIYGAKVTFVDFGIYLTTDFLLKFNPTALEKYSNLQKLRASVSGLPNIAKWLKERPEDQPPTQ